MTKEPAFWDSSALVPLCVREDTSRKAHAQLRKFLPVVWWATPVEIHSAIRRAHLLGHLDGLAMQQGLSRLQLLSGAWREILPGDELRDLAGDLLDAHDLRAADSLQLAAALIWCQRRPARRSFLSADRRLSRAAADRGFSVLEL